MPDKQQDSLHKVFGINRTDPNHLQSIFANDFALSSTGHEVFLIFSQVQPPLAVSPAAVEQQESLDAVAVARIVVTPKLARAIVKVMTDNIKAVADQ